ncbi:hypothetical protein [Streptomyces sp. NPDC058964]|uniref:hypothetical protein n=1 Tax=Streptomyces sp. NPDC058964 TaxID=3346681 RepID=UPI0036ACEE9A
MDLPTDPDARWSDARWNAVVVPVRSLRARGAQAGDEHRMADRGLDEEDLEEGDSWGDDRSLSRPFDRPARAASETPSGS